MADERWLTYDEVADMRATSRDAAVRWVQRRKLRRQPGNDGRVRVLVPPNVLEDAHPTRTPQTDPIAPPNGVVQALEGAIDTLRQQLVRADARTDEMRVERDQARDRVEAAEQRARTAQETVDELRRENDARRARGRWRRALAAWRGRD